MASTISDRQQNCTSLWRCFWLGVTELNSPCVSYLLPYSRVLGSKSQLSHAISSLKDRYPGTYDFVIRVCGRPLITGSGLNLGLHEQIGLS